MFEITHTPLRRCFNWIDKSLMCDLLYNLWNLITELFMWRTEGIKLLYTVWVYCPFYQFAFAHHTSHHQNVLEVLLWRGVHEVVFHRLRMSWDPKRVEYWSRRERKFSYNRFFHLAVKIVLFLCYYVFRVWSSQPVVFTDQTTAVYGSA
jgi:hypothetical protein